MARQLPTHPTVAATQHGRGLRSLGIGLAWLLAALLLGCTRPPPEAAVRAQLQVLEQAIAARDAGALREVLAPDFVGNDGLDRDGARRLAAGLFLRHRAVRARLGPVEVQVHGPAAATTRFTVVLTGGNGGLLPDTGQAYRVEAGWRQQGGEWRLRSAVWEPVLR